MQASCKNSPTFPKKAQEEKRPTDEVTLCGQTAVTQEIPEEVLQTARVNEQELPCRRRDLLALILYTPLYYR